ncbi:MAG: hypothetical protein M1379_08820 [Firmicutes bacterium]|nr:hypothetical protein [Bacillota bacterium]
MKKWIALVTLATLLVASAPVFAGDTYNDGWLAGQMAGQSRGTFFAGLGGFASGLLFGPVGGAVAIGISAIGAPQPPVDLQMMSLEGKSPEYRQGFFQGYGKRAWSKKFWTTTTWAAVGTLIRLGAEVAKKKSSTTPTTSALPAQAPVVSFGVRF